MAKGCDYSFYRPTDAELAPFDFVFRYAGGSASKELTAAEANHLKALGKRIGANFESTGKGGDFNQGVADAKYADAHFRSCGATGDFVIFFSIDEDVPVASQDGYFKGINSVIGVARTDVYGSTGLSQHLRAAGLIRPGLDGWRTMSTGWTGGAGSTGEFAITQDGYGLNGQVDVDTAYAPLESFTWVPGEAASVTPASNSSSTSTVSEDDMAFIPLAPGSPVCIPNPAAVNGGGTGKLAIGCDFGSTTVRVATYSFAAKGWSVQTVAVSAAGGVAVIDMPQDTNKVSLDVQDAGAAAVGATVTVV